MKRRRMIIVGSALIIPLVAILCILLFHHSTAEFAIFKDHRERFEAIQYEVQRLASDRRHIEDSFLFKNGGNASLDWFHEELGKDL